MRTRGYTAAVDSRIKVAVVGQMGAIVAENIIAVSGTPVGSTQRCK